MTISTIHITDQSELYRHYQGQTNSQDCYIEIDCKNEVLSASYDAEIGNAVPFSVYHGHDQRIGIPCLLPSVANEFLDKITPIVQRVVDGYHSHWDGNNMVAKFDTDATNALKEIEEMCIDLCDNSDESTTVQEWDAGDYLDGVICYRDSNNQQCQWDDLLRVTWGCDYPDITGKSTDSDLDKIIEEIDTDCKLENVVLYGLEKMIYDLRNQCRENMEYNNQ